MTGSELQRVNEKRKSEKYIDSDAAILKRGTDNKQPLTTSPLYTEFEYGAQEEGYWTYEHLILQCKDVADCIGLLYPEVKVHHAWITAAAMIASAPMD